MSKQLNAIVVGVGSLGQHHARVYAQHESTRLMAVVDQNQETRENISRLWGCQGVSCLEEVDGSIDLASVAVPTTAHFETACWLLERGVPVLVEKPVTRTVEEGERLLALAESKSLPIQVGHIERFNPAVLELGNHLKNPLFIEAHRLGPPAPRVQDVGVVLDLMIHDLDLILELVRSDVQSIDAVGVPIVTAQEDIANARIRFESGCVANVTVSRVTPERQRKIRFFQRDTYISLDFMKPDLQIYQKTFRADGSIHIQHQCPQLTTVEPLQLELDAFVQCVQQGTPPVVSGQDGVNALKLASQITQQVQRSASYWL